MSIIIKLFLSVLAILLFLYLVTTGSGLMNAPSDMSVVFGVSLIFAGMVILVVAIRYIWFTTVTLSKKESK